MLATGGDPVENRDSGAASYKSPETVPLTLDTVRDSRGAGEVGAHVRVEPVGVGGACLPPAWMEPGREPWHEVDPKGGSQHHGGAWVGGGFAEAAYLRPIYQPTDRSKEASNGDGDSVVPLGVRLIHDLAAGPGNGVRDGMANDAGMYDTLGVLRKYRAGGAPGWYVHRPTD